MSKKIIKAQVTGKHQNRTALGMMTAFVAMHPSVNTSTLKEMFTTKDVCPDAGISQLFYSKSEIEQEQANGNEWFINDNACFTKDGEWLTLGNGRKLAFNKVWTAKSLEKLQTALADYGITGEVGTVDKSAAAGFEICFESVEVQVTGKFQNRTALGMMAAYVALNPSLTAEELNEQFPMKEICPDAGVEKLFFSEDEIDELIASGNEWFINGNACFDKDGEWLELGNGQKVAFNKVWTAKSLEKLQAALAEHGITGEVGSVDKSAVAGYAIDFDNSTQTIVF